MKKILAQRVDRIDASGIRKVFAKAAAMEDPVNFSIGQPDFDVPEPLKQKAIEAIQNGFNHYSQTTGDEALCRKTAQAISRDTGWTDPAVMVTSGVSGALLLAFMAMIDPGDEVIIPDPYFVIYKHVIHMLGGKCVFVDTYPDFRLHVDKIESAISDRTKLIIANSPSNPTGMVYPKEEVQQLAELAAKNDIVVMSDEIYDRFCYDEPFNSVASYYENTLLIKGFSKTCSMTGWRLGIAACHPKLRFLIEEMAKIQQYTFVCAPTPFQKAAVEAIDYDISEYIESYRSKRDLIYNGLKGHFEIVKPAGAFYAFVKAPVPSATEFVEKAIENNVLIIPGSVFSEKDTHFRISYATSDEKIKEGVEILCSLT